MSRAHLTQPVDRRSPPAGSHACKDRLTNGTTAVIPLGGACSPSSASVGVKADGTRMRILKSSIVSVALNVRDRDKVKKG